MLRNLTTSFLRTGRIETTVTRAEEVQRQAEHMISLAKEGSLHARRQVLAYLYDEDVVSKLFSEIGPNFKDRSGGYTRIIKTGVRQGDAAPLAILELVS
jgi:large subunit ribosomal protein L17